MIWTLVFVLAWSDNCCLLGVKSRINRWFLCSIRARRTYVMQQDVYSGAWQWSCTYCRIAEYECLRLRMYALWFQRAETWNWWRVEGPCLYSLQFVMLYADALSFILMGTLRFLFVFVRMLCDHFVRILCLSWTLLSSKRFVLIDCIRTLGLPLRENLLSLLRLLCFSLISWEWFTALRMLRLCF